MSTLLFERSLPRFAAARIASSFGSGRGAGVGPLRLLDHEAPALPGDGWVHIDPLLSGICGSDLATLDGRSSRYFEDIVSFPFVPGHEVVGLLADDGVAADGRALPAGTRVVLQPVLGCAARGIEPPCAACAAGHVGNCERVAFGHIRPGLQTGFCADTGGGWSTSGLVAHASQLFPVPDGLSDADAVTVEPVACAVHAVLGAGIRDDDVVAVLGRRHPGPHRRRRADPPGLDRSMPDSSGGTGRSQVRPPATPGPGLRRHGGPSPRPVAPRRAPAARTRCPSAATRAKPSRCPAGPMWCSTAWAVPNRSPRAWPWSVPGAPWRWWACRAR